MEYGAMPAFSFASDAFDVGTFGKQSRWGPKQAMRQLHTDVDLGFKVRKILRKGIVFARASTWPRGPQM